MFYFNSLKKSKGQALVEAALITPLIVFFLFTVIWFARIMLTWQQISGAARYGTDLIAYTPFSANYIKNDIKDYLCNEMTIGRILDRNKVNVAIEISDFEPINYSLEIKSLESLKNFNPLKILNQVKDMTPLTKNSYVEITYSYKAPPLLSLIKNEITIKSRSEVLSGGGSAGYKVRDKK